MSYIKVNTEAALQVSSQIQTESLRIQHEIDSLQKKVSRLRSSWSGQAADQAIYDFDKILKGKINIETILKNYSEFLKVNVAQGGEIVEVGNTDLADEFI